MCYIVHAINRRRIDEDGSRAIVDAQILRKLVKRPLHKGAVNAVDRLASVHRNAGGKRHCGFLRNADIYELAARLPPFLRCKA